MAIPESMTLKCAIERLGVSRDLNKPWAEVTTEAWANFKVLKKMIIDKTLETITQLKNPRDLLLTLKGLEEAVSIINRAQHHLDEGRISPTSTATISPQPRNTVKRERAESPVPPPPPPPGYHYENPHIR